MRFQKWFITTTLLISLYSFSFAEPSFVHPGIYFNIKNYGAVGDGETMETAAINKAIDECFKSGGGTVYFPPGMYLSGSIHLKSHVAIYLDHGATILGSPNDQDYDPYEKLDFETDSDRETSFFHRALLWGENVENIAIIGTGTINSNRKKRGGPKPIALKRCRNVIIKDITILNAPNYAISLLGTDYVNIDGVTILNGYCDGIDPDCSQHVRISNCHIETWDDAIVPKASFSLGEVRNTEYLTVTNCQLATNCNAFKLGTESRGDFKYITFSNSVIFPRDNGRPATSGISLESVDRSNIDGITISNISMNGIKSPIFMRLGNRGRDQNTAIPGSLKNVVISNITATNAELPCIISGIPEAQIENVMLDNINITFVGDGPSHMTKIDVPEKEGSYPEATMFGDLPSYGFYIRHVDGIKLEDIRVQYQSPDYRHALYCDDVKNLDVESFLAQTPTGNESLFKFNNIQSAYVKGCVPKDMETFLSISGQMTRNISLYNNDFRQVKNAFTKTENVATESILLRNNF